MSTKAFDEALDFLPPARTRKGGGFGQTIVSFITALADGRNAEVAAAEAALALNALNGKREGVTFNVGAIDGGSPVKNETM